MTTCVFSWLFAAYRVLLRLLAPRHPPYALSSLTIEFAGLVYKQQSASLLLKMLRQRNSHYASSAFFRCALHLTISSQS